MAALRSALFAAFAAALAAAVASAASLAPSSSPAKAPQPPPASASAASLVDLGVEAYAFLFPLVLVDTTRQHDPLVHKPNHLFSSPIFVPPLIHEVVRPNVDTLYTLAWLNLTAEPVVLSVPDTAGAYYVLQLLDLWSSTFAAPGKRTTGTTAQSFVICGPRAKLCLPTPPQQEEHEENPQQQQQQQQEQQQQEQQQQHQQLGAAAGSAGLTDGLTVLCSPTEDVWMIGRTQCNGTADYAAVHAIQKGYKLLPLSQWHEQQQQQQQQEEEEEGEEEQEEQQHGAGANTGAEQAAAPAAPPCSRAAAPLGTAPDIVAAMDAEAFFTAGAALLARNPPTADDAPFLRRVYGPLGLPTDGSPLAWAALPQAARAALNASLPLAQAAIAANASAIGNTTVNGWKLSSPDIGAYGTDYALRAAVGVWGLGANLPADAVYIKGSAPFESGDAFSLTFAAPAPAGGANNTAPPVRAFWSVTAYDSASYLAHNALGRYALHDWDPLVYAPDGSLTLYLGAKRPPAPACPEANWLPTPADGGNWTLLVRLYWPEDAAIAGSWRMPPLVRM